MFFVLNREKICAYIVSVLTVCFLFFIAGITEDTKETSSNIIRINIKDENNVIKNNIDK